MRTVSGTVRILIGGWGWHRRVPNEKCILSWMCKFDLFLPLMKGN
ncbi:hypothetical protein [Neobacillus drentensis]